MECTSAEERGIGREREKEVEREERLRPGDTHTRSANNRRALSLCSARYYKHQNGPQSYINRHFPSASLSSLPVYPLVRSRFPTDHPLVSSGFFSPFHRRKNVSRQNIHKTGPFRAIRDSRFQAALATLPFPSSFFPHGPPSVNRERQLVRAFTRDFKIKRKII